MLADKSSELLGCWMEAGLSGGDWRTPLDLTAQTLGAAGMVLVRRDSSTMTLSVCSGVSIDFVLRCRELARKHWDCPQQFYALHLGFISWASCEAGPADRRVTVTVFALHGYGNDPAALQSVANIAACSLAVRARLDAIQAAAALKAAAFDRLPFGVAIVDLHLNVVEMNEACRRMIARADGLALMQQRLSCRNRGDQAALSRAVSAALAGDGTSPVVQVIRSGAAEPYAVRVLSTGDKTEKTRRCLLMIIDPESGPPLANDLWRAMFDLSDSELLIAESIVAGRSPADVHGLHPVPRREARHTPA